MTGGHRQFKEQLPAFALGALNPTERSELEHHLESCAECRAEVAWLQPATEVLATEVEPVEPSPALRRRVIAAVDADLAASGDAVGDEGEAQVEAGEAHPSREPRKPRSARRDRLRGLLRPAVVGAAAAALCVGIVVGAVLNGGDSPTSPERQVLTGRSTIGAEAVMVASNGTGTLKMTNLERPEGGRVYQAWIQRGQTVEPIESLFVPDRDGTAVASIPDLNGVTAVMVSAEPAGGSPQPTNAPVITVPVPG